MPLVQLMVLMS